MAQIIIEVPNAIAPRVSDAICNNNGYTGTHNGQPETKLAFVKRWFIGMAKNEIRVYESRIAENNATTQVINDIENNINLS